MASIEIGAAANAVCHKCGTQYGTMKGYFPICHSYLNKGVGYLPYCKRCVDEIYELYLAECGDPTKAIRQVCRKLDIYWSSKACDQAIQQSSSKTAISTYLTKINTYYYAGKSYDDTLIEECKLWECDDNDICDGSDTTPDPTEEIKAFWGPGYTAEMYAELEARLQYYRSQMDESMKQDLGTDALLRQIAMLEIDINKARAGGSSVDKMVSTLNSLLSNLSKPAKKSEEINSSTVNTPFGVWIKKWEDERPLPEIDESLKDVDGITKYVLTWVYGHIAHMLKVKNARTKLYDEAIAELRVERPEYDDEDDESMLEDIFGRSEGDISESSG